MRDNHRSQSWHGVPRDEILWQPLVQSCLCDGCGLCVTTCPSQALFFDFELGLPFVESMRCLVGCSICATICPNQAILLPDPKTLWEIIERYHLTLSARQELKSRRKTFSGAMPQAFDTNDIADRQN